MSRARERAVGDRRQHALVLGPRGVGARIELDGDAVLILRDAILRKSRRGIAHVEREIEEVAVAAHVEAQRRGGGAAAGDRPALEREAQRRPLAQIGVHRHGRGGAHREQPIGDHPARALRSHRMLVALRLDRPVGEARCQPRDRHRRRRAQPHHHLLLAPGASVRSISLGDALKCAPGGKRPRTVIGRSAVVGEREALLAFGEAVAHHALWLGRHGVVERVHQVPHRERDARPRRGCRRASGSRSRGRRRASSRASRGRTRRGRSRAAGCRRRSCRA